MAVVEGSLSVRPVGVIAGAPTNGPTGTGAGSAYAGALLINLTAGTVYRNDGGTSNPVWTLLPAADPDPVPEGPMSIHGEGAARRRAWVTRR